MQAIEAAERFADGVADRKQLKRAKKNADDVVLALTARMNELDAKALSAARAVSLLAERGKLFDRFRAIYVATIAAEALDDAQATIITNTGITTTEMRFQARLLRCIFGNPFKLYQAPPFWPTTVVQLAGALYQGQDCRLPFSDALEEAGHVELAEHFRKEGWHPKGCWAMDVVLGKDEQ